MKMDIMDTHYNHSKRFCKDFEIKNQDEHHDLYIKHNTLLLANVFEHFRKICLEISQIDPAKCFSPPRLA